jgi:hypothetical protein
MAMWLATWLATSRSTQQRYEAADDFGTSQTDQIAHAGRCIDERIWKIRLLDMARVKYYAAQK